MARQHKWYKWGSRLFGIVLPLAIIFLFPVIPARISDGDFFSLEKKLELIWLDFLYSFRGDRPPPDNIVVVAIDENSFAEIGLQWPWPRKMHAELVNQLHQAGVKGIAFDIIFADPGHDPAGDEIFAAAIRKANNVILAASITTVIRDEGKFEKKVEPIPLLAAAARHVGLAYLKVDPDGIIRQAYKTRDGRPSLSGGLYQLAAEQALKDQTTDEDNVLIDFTGKSGSIKTVSYYQALKNYLPPESLKNKLVLIGLSSDSAVDVSQKRSDSFFTPFFRFSQKAMFGVEIHANALATFLNEKPLHELKFWWLPLCFIPLVLLPIFFHKQPLALTTLSIVLLSSLAVMSCWLFIKQQIVFLPTTPALAFIASSLWWAGSGFVETIWEKSQIRNMFSKYVSPDVVREALLHPEKLQLGGTKKELTVLFSDIRNFTTLSEMTTPEKLVAVLNLYFTEMTEIILFEKGTLDKFIGDAIMAIFGAPVDHPDHAARSCRSALAMIKALASIGDKWEEQQMPRPRIGIGINTGMMVVGNIGAERRLDYTVIGDEVNLASRLEGLTKNYQVEIIISENTKNQIDDSFICRELDSVRVKGKEKPVRIFELFGLQGKIASDDSLAIQNFSNGLALYRSQDWNNAEKAFNDVLKVRPKDGPSTIFLDRCAILRHKPPASDWDGVWIMTSK